MRLTYIREDKIVGIDGVFYTIDNSNFDQEIDVIQWYDTSGEIEYVDRQKIPNKVFDDELLIKSLVELWKEKSEEEKNSIDSNNPTYSNFISSNQKIIDQL